MKSRIEFDKSLILIAAIILVVAAAVFLIIRNTRTDSITEMIENGKDINSVFLIHDGEELLFTEILFYNTSTAKGALLDVPGETGIIIKKLGKFDRIDQLYNQQDPLEYIRAVENMIKQEIEYYYQINLKDFVSLVDIVGGLEMFIDNPIEIIDNEQIVLLPSGSIVLDGDKVETYISYHDPDESETEASGRREKTIQSLLKAFQQQSDVLLNDKMFNYFKRTLDTNVDDSSLEAFIAELENLDTGRIVFQRVLGTRRTVDEQELLFSHYDGTLLRETVRQTVTSLANVDVVSDDELNVTIEILNGTAVNGMASRTSQVFQSFGYDVAHIGNYESSDVEKTFVIDKRGDIVQAQRVANVIQCSNVESQAPENGDFELFSGEPGEDIDLIIVLGKDFDGRYCKE
ncbi:MAG: LCP family protein [Spirochaetales bacterium]|uniref:LCP family protein n=1 Tax=Candidatus Thalassospirochaeta sargassi TaxID=3119039 RepID=A0AAJ1ID55_9SPIO|nr:LCP family protein [Spirochaetales bacterium]